MTMARRFLKKRPKVTARTTRNKIRHQSVKAWEKAKETQEHLLGIAALADDRSEYINDNFPPIVAAHEMIMNALEKFFEGL